MTNLTPSALTSASEPCERQETAAPRQTFRPRVDIIDAPEAVFLVADIPGADESETEVTLENDMLTIRASVSTADCGCEPDCCAEYGVGDYDRRFKISDEIDRDRVEATVKNGVLRVKLGKTESAGAKKVRVTART